MKRAVVLTEPFPPWPRISQNHKCVVFRELLDLALPHLRPDRVAVREHEKLDLGKSYEMKEVNSC